VKTIGAREANPYRILIPFSHRPTTPAYVHLVG
jgi:hypothetical protein